MEMEDSSCDIRSPSRRISHGEIIESSVDYTVSDACDSNCVKKQCVHRSVIQGDKRVFNPQCLYTKSWNVRF